MSVTVVNTATPKAAKVLRYSLKPLSLQMRIYNPPIAAMERPRSSMIFKGNDGMAVSREWVQSLFFDVPPKADDDEVECTYTFRNVFTNAITTVFFRANELRFESESASTITIAKERIEQLATSRRVQIQENISNDDVNDETVVSYLNLVFTIDKLYFSANFYLEAAPQT